ncbi:hypothetical protein AVEN_241349-1 [Araneus ventricosus]|uniref:Uncharacterized protein n=1 Tax=Araneus ventricosus TaxID=182803 RepID=A0A4Y2IMA1_ARAVE|nr:hypothetical protein AVEN_241349-1 [Araneus ventricosus]
MLLPNSFDFTLPKQHQWQKHYRSSSYKKKSLEIFPESFLTKGLPSSPKILKTTVKIKVSSTYKLQQVYQEPTAKLKGCMEPSSQCLRNCQSMIRQSGSSLFLTSKDSAPSADLLNSLLLN